MPYNSTTGKYGNFIDFRIVPEFEIWIYFRIGIMNVILSNSSKCKHDLRLLQTRKTAILCYSLQQIEAKN